MGERMALDRVMLATPLAEVRGMRADLAEAFGMLGARTVGDAIKHLPMRYERLEAETTIDRLAADQLVSTRGEITATKASGYGPRTRVRAVLMDHTGRMELIWFNAPFMRNRVFPGLRVRVQGKARRTASGFQLANPKIEFINQAGGEPETREEGVRPVYPASEQITSGQIEVIVRGVLGAGLEQIDDHLPEGFRRERAMPALADAYRMAHAPETLEQADEARRRLAYDELLLLQLGVFLRRAQLRRTTRAPALRWGEQIDAHIRSRFPFALTAAQDRVVREIIGDLKRDEPSNRLIQGDVGSGKTVVALYAMLLAVASRRQAALMAPTEILAEQHFLSIGETLKGSNARVDLLTGGLSQAEREGTLARLARGGGEGGGTDIVIGTHALLTEGVRFADLGVVVIDEQHRFGVHQRATLRSKGGSTGETEGGKGGERESGGRGSARLFPAPDMASAAKEGRAGSETELPVTPHVLVMTATPIPRTLALTLLGDLDISTIDELPPGRAPISTRVVGPELSGEVYGYVRTRLDAGDQAYIVVPAIDSGASTAGDGGDVELNDLRTVQARLESGELAGKRVAALHGRLGRETREQIMARFRAGAIDALVCTTVIEVGVDVPNAAVMVVEHAERFGLAQLHQLRGRVGRGSKRSACILIAEPVTPDAQARVAAIAGTTDGFALAEKDLEIRGPGEVFGMRQAGAPPFKVADLMRDRELLAMARRDAKAWIERSPTLHGPGEDLLRRRLLKAHGQWLGLGDVG